MGIKGIYKELGPGKRISLSKLAADSLESTGRPYRIAIDFAIWHFQTQAAQGGTNPALRTLFYRLVRLLGTPIQPIFVFDGLNKPQFKRNKRSGRGDGAATAAAKHLIRLFGFPTHDAPGEGEAECALLQRHGVVDAVLSEDVDTIMFGCTKTLRNWSSETKTSTAPTHVSLYDVDDMALGPLGLDREGMVLIALMSGGDYLPDGIPGCGVKVACEAAQAGFGKSVCRLKASDRDGIQAWRNSLRHELQTNEKGCFRTKHKALKIPQDFPNIEVLRYYTHPVVSSESNIEAIRQKMEQRQAFHLEALREFTRETFDWDYRTGALKFIRVIGQAMLVRNMANSNMPELQHVKRISGRRTHFSTDGTPELRLAYIPEEVVPIDWAKEVDEIVDSGRTGLALNSDEEFDVHEEIPAVNARKIFDVSKPDLAWVLEGLVKKHASDVFQEWQLREQAKAVRRSPTKTKKTRGIAKALKASDMPRGSLDKYVTVTKAAVSGNQTSSKAREPSLSPLKSLARPSARPSISKQSSSSPTRSPKPTTTSEGIDGSPVTPRSSSRQPDAIYISSSPPAPVSNSPAPPTSISASTPSVVSKLQLSKGVPESICSIVEASHSSAGLRNPLQRQRRRQEAETCSPVPKQSCMELFLSKSETRATEKRATLSEREKGRRINYDSDLESIPARPVRHTRQVSVEEAAAVGGEAASSEKPGLSPKKKLFRARASGSGFFEEVELCEEERHAELNAELGRKGVAVRWSDVSVIDLTGDEEQQTRAGLGLHGD
ncbi:DNA repair protein (XPGC)/ Rad [Metarhizium album ARSEF 1941]|uniref:DNA repair protein (XPGC)/ Rad n=1 Tax=Metarhizium album (strain ARSEF 1941) TaxID=1081103 RepID=A0A0B2WUM4_METAS|nr:DNA repair protein (XPGC)/ Rad [Metarhizium album ARSEF 1941]KHN97763.1 DNA repair protein (XPGC)/ Rad [Metarhizium album ARSEF 1941]